MPEKLLPLFVYGSSRKGQIHSCDDRAVFICAALAHGYILYELSVVNRSYVVPSTSPKETPPLSGELYTVDQACLDSLDEEHQLDKGLYDRVLIDVSMPDGKLTQAWIYEGNRIVPLKVECGDWDCRWVEPGKA